MKRLLYFFSFALLLAACGGDDDAAPSKTSGNCLRVDLDGETFESSIATFTKVPNIVDSSGVVIESDLYTILATGPIETILSPPPIFTLVFGCAQIVDQNESDPLSADCGLGASYTNVNTVAGTGDMYESDGTSGQLTITMFTDTRIEGTFSFDLEGTDQNELDARNGFFSIER